jgi:glucosamine-6-phosphate deaminase
MLTVCCVSLASYCCCQKPEHLFQHIDIVPENVHLLNGNADDLKAECQRYEAAIQKHGGIELFLGGIGPDGHIAFNEGGSSLTSRTRVKTLAYDTVVANARFFGGDMKQVPKMALTVGVGTIMDAREVIVIVTGQHKADALEKCVEQGVNHMFTCSALQMHPCSAFVCDEAATNELRVRTVKYFKGLESIHSEFNLAHIPTQGKVPSFASGKKRAYSESKEETQAPAAAAAAAKRQKTKQ